MRLTTILEAVEPGYDATITVRVGANHPWHVETRDGRSGDLATFAVAKNWLVKLGMVHVRDDGQTWYFRKK